MEIRINGKRAMLKRVLLLSMLPKTASFQGVMATLYPSLFPCGIAEKTSTFSGISTEWT